MTYAFRVGLLWIARRWIFRTIPLILFSNLIPITYAGLGLREKFAIEVLSKYGISSEIAITASLTVFIFNVLIPAVVGLYYIIRSKRKVK